MTQEEYSATVSVRMGNEARQNDGNYMKRTKAKEKSKVSSEIVTITPVMASAWLTESKFDNRRLDDRNVDKIALDIKTGKWVFDGNPIRFSSSGDILDGQHRLWAIVTSGKPVDSLVVHGLDNKSKDTIDTGKSRTVADVLHFNGHFNNALLAATCRLAIGHGQEEGDMMKWAKSKSSQRLSTQDILDKASNDKRLSEAVSAILPLAFVRKFLGGSVACFAYYLLRSSCKSDGHLVDKFFISLEKGQNLEADDTILLLRNTLSIRDMKAYYTKGGHIMSAYRLALVIKAWNAWRAKKPLQVLKYNDDTEKFPVPQ